MTLLRLLQKLEWSGIVHGEGYSMGTIGRPWVACPYCGQAKPGSGAECDFSNDAIGHKSRCQLKVAIKSLQEAETCK